MRKYLLVSLLGLGFLFATTSCEKENSSYPLGDFLIELGVVSVDNNGSYYFTLDDGQKLWCSTCNIKRLGIRPNQRVLVNYTKLNDQATNFDLVVRLNDLDTILTKPIIRMSPGIEDSIGDDPIQVYDIWASGGFANFYYSFSGGATRHLINLVVDSTETQGPITLRLRHNSKGDSLNYRYSGYICFRLESLREHIHRDSISFRLKYKTTNGEMLSKVFAYKFKQ